MVKTDKFSLSFILTSVIQWHSASSNSTDVTPVTTREPSEAIVSVEPYVTSVTEDALGLGSPEPESTPEPEPETTLPFVEPTPNWEDAKRQWGVAWEVHIYVFGILFALLALYCVVSVVRLFRRKQLLTRRYFIALNALIFFLSALRSVYLLVDAYNSKQTFLPFLQFLLYAIPFLCLTSAFSLLFFALLQTLRMTFISAKIQKLKYLICIIMFHFIFAIVTGVVLGVLVRAEILELICQAIFVVWGLFLFLGFLAIFLQLFRFAKRRQEEEEILKRSYRNTSQINGDCGVHVPRYTASLAVVATLISSIFGLIVVALHAYSIYALSYLSTEIPQPWDYWIIMTIFRFTEFCMCALIAYISTQPIRYSTTDRRNIVVLSCTRCCHQTFDRDNDCDFIEPSTKANHTNEDSIPLCGNTTEKLDFLQSTPKGEPLQTVENGFLGFMSVLDSDSIKFIDDDSTRSVASSESDAILPDYAEKGPQTATHSQPTESGPQHNSNTSSSPNMSDIDKPMINVSEFENHLAEQVRPRGRLNRTPALDENSSWQAGVSKSGEIPQRPQPEVSQGQQVAPLEAEDAPRVKYRLKQRHPLMQRSSSEGGPFPVVGNLNYVSSSDSEGDVPPVDRVELAKSADLSEFNQDVQDAMACLIDDSSQEFIEMEADV